MVGRVELSSSRVYTGEEMSVETARAAVYDAFDGILWDDELPPGALTATAALDRLILEVRAAMPCYDHDLDDNYRDEGLYDCAETRHIAEFGYIGLCPTCAARRELTSSPSTPKI
mgnify:CR=1 FL=1